MKKQNNNLPPLPQWSDSVLQGLAYWIGYKKQYYRFYPLSEGAIVGETLSLLAAKIDLNEYYLDAEVMYKSITKDRRFFGQKRVDIIIVKKNESISKNNKNSYEYADDCILIEVKKYENNQKIIEEDFYKLAQFLSKTMIQKPRCFVLLVSQDKIPKEYVSEQGNAKRKEIKIRDTKDYVAKVRRVCKAVHKFNNKYSKASSKAYYACLIEIIKKPYPAYYY